MRHAALICAYLMGSLGLMSLTPNTASSAECSDCGCHLPAKVVIIGETALITVAEAELAYKTRIDTGARVTSLHAYDIVVKNGDKDAKKKESIE